MTFINEYIPPVEQETSEFLKRARKTLRTGYDSQDKWTVDRERNMVLFRRGGGHSIQSQHEDYWSFIDEKGYYLCDTNLLSKSEISSENISITRSIGFQSGGRLNKPDAHTISCIKEALQEYKDWGIKSSFKNCRLSLIDSVTGKEI